MITSTSVPSHAAVVDFRRNVHEEKDSDFLWSGNLFHPETLADFQGAFRLWGQGSALLFLEEFMKQTQSHNLIELHWDDMRSAARERWPELSDNELSLIEGHRDMLTGMLQEHYGVSRDEAERQTAEFEREWMEHAAMA